jgi:hypothetical protein
MNRFASAAKEDEAADSGASEKDGVITLCFEIKSRLLVR